MRIWKDDTPAQRVLDWMQGLLCRTPANPVRCEYCGVLHGNHAINCRRPQ